MLLFDLPGQIELYVHLDAFRHIFTYLERQGVRLCVAYCLDITFFSDAAKSLSGSLLALNAMLFFELPHVNILTKCDLVTKTNIIVKSNNTSKPKNKQIGDTRSKEKSSDSRSEEEESSSDEKDTGNQWAGRCLGTSSFGRRVDDVDAVETEEDMIVEQLLTKDIEAIVEELDENMPARYRALHRAFASILEEFGLVSFFPLNILNEDCITNLGALLRSTLQADEDEEPKMDYDFGAE